MSVLYLCRWPNGDISILHTPQGSAVEILDRVGDPSNIHLTPVKEGIAIHFHLNDQGELELEEFCDELEDVRRQVHPRIAEVERAVLMREDDRTAPLPDLHQAVQQERARNVRPNIFSHL